MPVIPPNDREELTEAEFLARVSEYGIECYLFNKRLRFLSPQHSDRRPSNPDAQISPAEAVRFVRDWKFEDQPILKFIASRSRPARVAVAWTPAGQKWFDSQRRWHRDIFGTSIPRTRRNYPRRRVAPA